MNPITCQTSSSGPNTTEVSRYPLLFLSAVSETNPRPEETNRMWHKNRTETLLSDWTEHHGGRGGEEEEEEEEEAWRVESAKVFAFIKK